MAAKGSETGGRRSQRRSSRRPDTNKPRQGGAFDWKRLKGFEPSTFCMASRRSSQLSYSRIGGILAVAGRWAR